jgi:hypothetical protein
VLYGQQDGAATTAPADPLLKAMHDELERSRKITISNLEPPYFIQYIIDEGENFNISASSRFAAPRSYPGAAGAGSRRGLQVR